MSFVLFFEMNMKIYEKNHGQNLNKNVQKLSQIFFPHYINQNDSENCFEMFFSLKNDLKYTVKLFPKVQQKLPKNTQTIVIVFYFLEIT